MPVTESDHSYQRREVRVGEYRQALSTHEAHSLIGPNNVILQVNYGCYLECEMCDRHNWIAQGASNNMSMTTDELSDLFHELSSLNTQKITLVGTEPVMRPDLPEILASIHDKKMKTEMYTAGILLKENVIASILENDVDVAFSIDGFYPKSHNGIRVPNHSFDAFGKTLESTHRLRQARKQARSNSERTAITANFTIQRGNIQDLLTVFADDIDALGVDTLRLSLVHGDGSYKLNKEDISTIAAFCLRLKNVNCRTTVDLSPNILFLTNGLITPDDFDNNVLIPSQAFKGQRKTGCHIGEMSTMIDPQGNVRPCLYLYDDNGPFNASDRDQFILGDLRSQRFKDIWNGPAYEAFRKAYTSPNYSKGSRCQTCEYFSHFQEIDAAIANADNSRIIQLGW